MVTRNTVEDLGAAVLQVPQEALRGLTQQDLSDSTVRDSVLSGLQQICDENHPDCLATAWIVLNKVAIHCSD